MLIRFKEQFIAQQLSDISSIHRYGTYRGAGGRPTADFMRSGRILRKSA